MCVCVRTCVRVFSCSRVCMRACDCVHVRACVRTYASACICVLVCVLSLARSRSLIVSIINSHSLLYLAAFTLPSLLSPVHYFGSAGLYKLYVVRWTLCRVSCCLAGCAWQLVTMTTCTLLSRLISMQTLSTKSVTQISYVTLSKCFTIDVLKKCVQCMSFWFVKHNEWRMCSRYRLRMHVVGRLGCCIVS